MPLISSETQRTFTERFAVTTIMLTSEQRLTFKKSIQRSSDTSDILMRLMSNVQVIKLITNRWNYENLCMTFELNVQVQTGVNVTNKKGRCCIITLTCNECNDHASQHTYIGYTKISHTNQHATPVWGIPNSKFIWQSQSCKALISARWECIAHAGSIFRT